MFDTAELSLFFVSIFVYTFFYITYVTMCKFGFIFVKHLRPVDSRVYWSLVVISGQWMSWWCL